MRAILQLAGALAVTIGKPIGTPFQIGSSGMMFAAVWRKLGSVMIETISSCTALSWAKKQESDRQT